MVHTAPSVDPHAGGSARWLIVRHIDVHMDLRSIPRDRRSSHRSGHQYHQYGYSHCLESNAEALVDSTAFATCAFVTWTSRVRALRMA